MTTNDKGIEIIDPEIFDYKLFRKQFPNVELRNIGITCKHCGKKWAIAIYSDQTNLTNTLPIRMTCDVCKK